MIPIMELKCLLSFGTNKQMCMRQRQKNLVSQHRQTKESANIIDVLSKKALKDHSMRQGVVALFHKYTFGYS